MSSFKVKTIGKLNGHYNNTGFSIDKLTEMLPVGGKVNTFNSKQMYIYNFN